MKLVSDIAVLALDKRLCSPQAGCQERLLVLTKMISQLAAKNEASANSLRRVPVGPL